MLVSDLSSLAVRCTLFSCMLVLLITFLSLDHGRPWAGWLRASLEGT